LKDYYFPIKKLQKGKIYTYINASDSSERYNWLVQTKINKGDTLVLTQVKDSKGRLTEEVIQEVSKTGMIMQAYKIIDYKDNKTKQKVCQVKEPYMYNWLQMPEDSVTWSVSYYDSTYSKNFELKKTRVFKKLDPERDLAKFSDYYYVKVGESQLFDHEVTSYYKRDVGLYKYTILYRNGVTKVFILSGQK